jgi:hypothetical protein
MAVYRFRIYLEDNEDVYRDIDIKASQSFELFHEAIQEAFKFDKKHAASFFTSDDYWRKGEEITLRKEDLELNTEDKRKNITKKFLMKEVKVAKFIEQPHQRFVYVFDPDVQWTFLIEMIKIVAEDIKLNYPACVRSAGTAPKQYKQTNMAKEELSPDLAMAALLNDPEISDEEIFKTLEGTEEGIEEDDLQSLEGEEGEEESDEDEFGSDEEEMNDSNYGTEFEED